MDDLSNKSINFEKEEKLINVFRGIIRSLEWNNGKNSVVGVVSSSGRAMDGKRASRLLA